jgi:hypothetical protein
MNEIQKYDAVLIFSCWFQEVANKLAKLAVRACARLGGYLTGDLESPNNSVTREILNRLLTPYLARQLSLDKPEEVSSTPRQSCWILYSFFFSVQFTEYFMCFILTNEKFDLQAMKEMTQVWNCKQARGIFSPVCLCSLMKQQTGNSGHNTKTELVN